MSNNWILLPHIQVQNANALSSSFTIGFPAMTAWLGAVHALQRKLNAKNIPVEFSGAGVVVHHFNLQTHKDPGGFEHFIIGTANPLTEKGERPPFIAEARCHLEVSILIEYVGIEAHQERVLLDQLHQLLLGGMKLAGGDILNCKEPEMVRDFHTAKRKLMPGYALIERRDLMQAAMEQSQDAMDALLDYLAIHHTCAKEENDNGKECITWQSKRKPTGPDGQTGWIAPIATGFHGISEPDRAHNQRDPEAPHRFAESVVTLGEFKMSYRLQSPEDLLWRYRVELENNLYLCVQESREFETTNSDY